MQQESYVQIEQQAGAAVITLCRPDVRNAFNPQLIHELINACEQLSADADTRVVLLEGAGTHFSAGADLEWMRQIAHASREENLADAQALAAMLDSLNSLPQRLIACVRGGAFGGALGIMACCDTVICSQECRFAFSEVRLGLSPATVAPYVISKIGASATRELFLSARVFDAEHALRVGLVHRIVPAEDLAQAVSQEVQAAMGAGPRAVMHTKALLAHLRPVLDDETLDLTARLIADLRASPEGQEGLSAFLEKRSPSWLPSN